MKKKSLIGIAALMVLTMEGGCSQASTPSLVPSPALASNGTMLFSQTVPDSYIVKAPGDGITVIRRVFAQYGVLLVKPLGNEQFEVRLERDPGLDTLKSLVEGSGGSVTAIQPNFVYHMN